MTNKAIQLDENGAPIPTRDCCEVWGKIKHEFRWYAFDDHPDTLAMPTITGFFRVNHCPSCGAYVRNSVWKPS